MKDLGALDNKNTWLFGIFSWSTSNHLPLKCRYPNKTTNQIRVVHLMYTGAPIRVGYTAKAGRGVFAIIDIADGELIHTADPVVAHPSIQSVHKVFFHIIPQNILTNGCLSKCTLGARFCFKSLEEQPVSSRLINMVGSKAFW